MSKNIVIQEGGVNKNLNSIKKILTDEQEGGSCNWIPEDEAERGTKTITKNGTYKASDDDLYGYSKVTVRVKGASGGGVSGESGSGVSGRNPDDGNDYAHEVDENHDIVTTKLPTRIVLSSLPYDTNYANGETIDFTGAEVTAYYADGGTYGAVPFNELSFEPTVASALDNDTYSDGDGVNAIMVTMISGQGWGEKTVVVGDKVLGQFAGRNATIISEDSALGSVILLTRYDGILWAKLVSGNPVKENLATFQDGHWSMDGGAAYTISKNVFDTGAWYNEFTYVPESTKNPGQAGNLVPSGNTQEITVSWPRIKDEKVLTTTFTINVTSSSNSQSSGGSSSGGNNSGGTDSGGGGSHGF